MTTASMSPIDLAIPPALDAPVQTSASPQNWARIAFLVLLLAYAGLMAAFFAPAINHPDANGYWAQASLIAKTGKTWFSTESRAQFVGMHWLLADSQINGKDVYVSRYPPGLPVLVAGVYQLFGWQASVLVNPILAILTLVGIYKITTRLLSPAWGLFAAFALAINGAFAEHALTAISHMPVAFCLVWGVYLLLIWSDTGKLACALAAGLLLGCIPTIRYADAIVAVGIALFLLLHAKKFPQIWKHYLAAAIGAFLPVLPLLIRNQLLFGAFWHTGYSLTNEESGFGWNYFTQHALGYLQMLQSNGVGLFFALAVIGLVCMLAGKRDRKIAALILGSTVPFLIVYMAYYWGGAGGGMGGGPGGGGPGGGPGGGLGGSMRFLVPIVPLFIIAAAYALAQITAHTPRKLKIAIPVTVLALQCLIYAPGMVQQLAQMKQREIPLAIATHGLEQVARDGDVVIASTGFLDQLDFVRKWKLADISVATGRGGGPGGGMPGGPGGMGMRGGFGRDRFGGPPDGGPDGDDASNRPSPMQQAKAQARAKLYTGSTEEREEAFLVDVQKWADGKSIYAIGSQSQIESLLPGVLKSEIEIVSRLKTPKAPDEPALPNARGRNVNRAGRTGGPGAFGGPGGPGGMPGGPGGNMGGPGGGMGGMFGPVIIPGEEIVIARWTPKRS